MHSKTKMPEYASTGEDITVLLSPQRFDITEYVSGKSVTNQGLAGSKYEESKSIFKDIDVELNQERMLISKSLAMTQKNELLWRGNFTIHNLTGINMTYIVFPSEVTVYFEPEGSWIGPKGTSTVTVYVTNANIKKFCNSGRITVLSSPVYKKGQLDSEIFTPFGSSFYSYSMESHTIKNIYPKMENPNCNWSILDYIYVGYNTLFGNR